MGRTYGSFFMLLLFQRIKIRCYNISRGYATDLLNDLLKKPLLTFAKHNSVHAKSRCFKSSLKNVYTQYPEGGNRTGPGFFSKQELLS
jgi:hypothetical protein